MKVKIALALLMAAWTVQADTITFEDFATERWRIYHASFEVSQGCIESIAALPGVSRASRNFEDKYSISVIRGGAFEWKKISEKIEKALKECGEEVKKKEYKK